MMRLKVCHYCTRGAESRFYPFVWIHLCSPAENLRFPVHVDLFPGSLLPNIFAAIAFAVLAWIAMYGTRCFTNHMNPSDNRQISSYDYFMMKWKSYHPDWRMLMKSVWHQSKCQAVTSSSRKWQDYVYIQCEYKSTKQKIKHLLREENKVKENKIS